MRPRVNKTDLIQTMRTNRDRHEQEYVEAAAKYRQAVIDELRKRANKISRAGDDADPGKIDDIDVFFNLPVPQRYTDSYDHAIAALEWHEGDKVELDQREFDRWVLNEWEWKHTFAANTQSYTTR